jgi:hypothetical protein
LFGMIYKRHLLCSPEGCWTVAGGNTPGTRINQGWHPGGVQEKHQRKSGTPPGCIRVGEIYSGGVTPGYGPARLRRGSRITRAKSNGTREPMAIVLRWKRVADESRPVEGNGLPMETGRRRKRAAAGNVLPMERAPMNAVLPMGPALR